MSYSSYSSCPSYNYHKTKRPGRDGRGVDTGCSQDQPCGKMGTMLMASFFSLAFSASVTGL